MGLTAAEEEDRQAFSARRAEEAQEGQKWRAAQKEALDDMLPKVEPGRSALHACPAIVRLVQAIACRRALAIVQTWTAVKMV